MLEVLDTAGQEEYTTLRDQWIREGEGFVLVYSITSRSSFTRIRAFYNQIQRAKEDSTESFAIVIVGNKSDRGVDEREVSTQEGEALARELGDVPFFESSAKFNINIETSFLTCAARCKRIRNISSPENSSGNAQQQEQQQQLFNNAPASQQQQHQQQDSNTPVQNNGTGMGANTNAAQTSQQAQPSSNSAAHGHQKHKGSSSGNKHSKKDKKCIVM